MSETLFPTFVRSTGVRHGCWTTLFIIPRKINTFALPCLPVADNTQMPRACLVPRRSGPKNFALPSSPVISRCSATLDLNMTGDACGGYELSWRISNSSFLFLCILFFFFFFFFLGGEGGSLGSEKQLRDRSISNEAH